jgi:hypothetical protein
MRRLPVWLAGGPIVSDVAYDLVAIALEPRELGAELAARITLAELAQALAARLEVDEADVLRAWAELKRVGVMT